MQFKRIYFNWEKPQILVRAPQRNRNNGCGLQVIFFLIIGT